MDYALICALISSILLPFNTSFFVEATLQNRPEPVDCKMKMWSSWSPCDSCTDTTHRFRYLEKPSQFGGLVCQDTQWDRNSCPRATQQCMVTDFCEETSFTCTRSGRCVDRELLCNGDRDCGDGSDEDGCEAKKREDKCSSLFPIPGANRATQGFNVLTGDFADHVLDHDYYGGLCEYVYNGDWKKFTYDAFCENLRYLEDEKNYRKPYNYHTYRFMAQATSEGSTEYYEDMNQLLRARQTENAWNFGRTVEVAYGGVGVELGAKISNEAKFLNNVTQYASQDLAFIRLVSRVQTAQFKMRSAGLVLSERMYTELMDLPEQYDFGRYSAFLKGFGTHYLTQGTLGGTLEYVMVVNKTAMATSDTTAEQSAFCFGLSIGLSSPVLKVAQVSVKYTPDVCKKDGSFDKATTSSSGHIKDVLSNVKGGTIGSSAGVLAIHDPDSYRKWGATLKFNPIIIDSETMPIYELVRLSTAASHAGGRLAHLKRSWDEYRLEFNACRCAPCRHNGVPALSQSACQCICKEGFRGAACQETHRKGSPTDGAWSCWGAWSSCQSGGWSRTRSCSNPPPDGGAACVGSSSQTRRC